MVFLVFCQAPDSFFGITYPRSLCIFNIPFLCNFLSLGISVSLTITTTPPASFFFFSVLFLCLSMVSNAFQVIPFHASFSSTASCSFPGPLARWESGCGAGKASRSSAPSAGLGIKSAVTTHPNKILWQCKQVPCVGGRLFKCAMYHLKNSLGGLTL